jgi:hypothetical protein
VAVAKYISSVISVKDHAKSAFPDIRKRIQAILSIGNRLPNGHGSLPQDLARERVSGVGLHNRGSWQPTLQSNIHLQIHSSHCVQVLNVASNATAHESRAKSE